VSVTLRKAIAFGASGMIEPGSAQDYRTGRNREWVLGTKTRWVRIWCDWPSLYPQKGQVHSVRLSALDDQIARAKRDGLAIILTLNRFPTWANGTAALTDAQLAATMPDRRRRDESDLDAKPLVYRYPENVGPGSDWAQWMEFVATRYSKNNSRRPNKGAWIDALEIMNEPNHEWWPQQAPSTTTDPWAQASVIVHRVVARMMQTAKGVNAKLGGEPAIMAPAQADDWSSLRVQTRYRAFADRVMLELVALGVTPGPRFMWTHHNYGDVGYDAGAGTTSPDAATNAARYTNRAADMRALLVGRWAGWPNGDAANPQIFITEGGALLSRIASTWGVTDYTQQRLKQADLLKRSWARMSSNTGEGAGIAMVSNLMLYSHPWFETGLAEPYEYGGAPRPSLDTWGSFPSYA
jgi:hypothetical protein